MEGHWRDSMRSPRFFALDARAALPFALLLVHFRDYTAYFAAAVTAVFFLAERAGLSIEAAMRRLRSFIVGPYRPTVIWTKRHEMTDFAPIIATSRLGDPDDGITLEKKPDREDGGKAAAKGGGKGRNRAARA